MKQLKSGTQEFHYRLAGVLVNCEVYWEEAEAMTQWEPGCPALATAETVMVGDTNIIELLSDEQREEIETAFLDQEVEA